MSETTTRKARRPKFSPDNVAAISCFLQDMKSHADKAVNRLTAAARIDDTGYAVAHLAYYQHASGFVDYMFHQLAHARRWSELNKQADAEGR